MDHKKLKIDWDSRDELLTLANRINSRLFEIDKKSINEQKSLSKLRREERNRKTLEVYMSYFDKDLVEWTKERERTEIDGINWDSIFRAIHSDDSLEYYVYAHLDPTNPIRVMDSGRIKPSGPRTAFAATLGMTHVPFYIGKGKGDRAFQLNRNETHRKIRQRIKANQQEVKVHVVKDGLSEKDTLTVEDKLIDIFGLQIDGGLLVNLDEGHSPPEIKRLLQQKLQAMIN